jgi:hypothetical protein
MTVGNPTINSNAKATKSLRYTYLATKLTRFPETPDFPTAPCAAGIIAGHHFPALVIPLYLRLIYYQ